MKILMVTNIWPTAKYPGRGSFVQAQVESIRREGLEVTVLYINAIDRRSAFFTSTLNLFRRSFTDEFDLIHAHFGTTGIVSRMQWRKPVVVSYLGSDLLGNPKSEGDGKTASSQMVALLCRAGSLAADAVIVKSEELKSMIPKKNKVFIIPNGVDFDLFRPMEKQSVRKKLNMHPEKRYVLFPSNAEWPRKCYPVAVKAVDILKKQGMPVELMTIYGQAQDRIPYYMNACDAMVLTSLWEGSPNVIKESMACNLPIVSVPVGDVPGIIGNCSGCYVIPRSPEQIAMKLKTILDHPCRTRGREAIRHLESGQVARRIIWIYDRLLKSRSGVSR